MGYIDGQAFLEHVVAQTRQNVDFLISQKQISPEAGREILSRLPPPGASDPVSALTTQAQNLSVAAPEPRSYDPPPSSSAVRAKALWDYNADGHDPNDLSFRSGDIIEVVHETNPDWWTGRHNGREGLFPSNYVEKLPPAALPPKPPSRSPSGPPPASPYSPPSTYAPNYQPPPGPPIGYQPPPAPYGGPPPPTVYNPYMNPPAPPPPQPVPAQAQQPPEKPPSRWGGLGNTMATSAAGGVGFGAGSAVGSGIINSIF
ncbi:hypothetical protein VKT23_011259 [Stygiomarasmius scandens]|uniref:SH3 domain-containing protein n=1 Tax=Marasmiellus scandens TaxID=2682957 RepID=A0ABR1J8Y1_9AGAR